MLAAFSKISTTPGVTLTNPFEPMIYVNDLLILAVCVRNWCAHPRAHKEETQLPDKQHFVTAAHNCKKRAVTKISRRLAWLITLWWHASANLEKVLLAARLRANARQFRLRAFSRPKKVYYTESRLCLGWERCSAEWKVNSTASEMHTHTLGIWAISKYYYVLRKKRWKRRLRARWEYANRPAISAAEQREFCPCREKALCIFLLSLNRHVLSMRLRTWLRAESGNKFNLRRPPC